MNAIILNEFQPGWESTVPLQTSSVSTLPRPERSHGAPHVTGQRSGGALSPPGRRTPRRGAVIRIPGGTADLAGNEVRYRDGQRCGLSEREASLLGYLASHAGRTVSRDELLSQVWGLNPERTLTRTIDMHVAKLRHKLRDQAGAPKVLLTVHGHGYLLAADHSVKRKRVGG
ncbi:MAG: winged helix-turn-helix transcriptional regulator [Verrucomicrobia bacterium]|nr:winged helix-turn-helix transcriptional regulator [Verrucomicrobiota bacterium]